MLSYLRRLLEPPNIVDVVCISAGVVFAVLVTGLLWQVLSMMGVSPLIALFLAIVCFWFAIAPVVGSWVAGLVIALCIETVVVTIGAVSSQPNDDWAWSVVGTGAAMLAIAIFHERMNSGEE